MSGASSSRLPSPAAAVPAVVGSHINLRPEPGKTVEGSRAALGGGGAADLIKISSRNQTKLATVAELAHRLGYQTERVDPNMVTPTADLKPPIRLPQPAQERQPPLPAAVIATMLDGRLYRLLTEPDEENPDPFVVIRLSAWKREREAIRRLLKS